MNWRPLIEFIVSVGYGLLSSVVPIFNSEIYIVASQVGGFTEEVTTAVGCAVGGHWQGRHRTRTPAGSRSNLRDGWSDGSAPASRPVAFGPSSGHGRTGCWDFLGENPVGFLSACPLFRRCAVTSPCPRPGCRSFHSVWPSSSGGCCCISPLPSESRH